MPGFLLKIFFKFFVRVLSMTYMHFHPSLFHTQPIEFIWYCLYVCMWLGLGLTSWDCITYQWPHSWRKRIFSSSVAISQEPIVIQTLVLPLCRFCFGHICYWHFLGAVSLSYLEDTISQQHPGPLNLLVNSASFKCCIGIYYRLLLLIFVSFLKCWQKGRWVGGSQVRS